jgi:hypothetical protein
VGHERDVSMADGEVDDGLAEILQTVSKLLPVWCKPKLQRPFTFHALVFCCCMPPLRRKVEPIFVVFMRGLKFAMSLLQQLVSVHKSMVPCDASQHRCRRTGSNTGKLFRSDACAKRNPTPPLTRSTLCAWSKMGGGSLF